MPLETQPIINSAMERLWRGYAKEMAPGLKVLATKPGSLNLILKSHIKIEGEHPLHEIVLWPLHLHMYYPITTTKTRTNKTFK